MISQPVECLSSTYHMMIFQIVLNRNFNGNVFASTFTKLLGELLKIFYHLDEYGRLWVLYIVCLINISFLNIHVKLLKWLN